MHHSSIIAYAAPPIIYRFQAKCIIPAHRGKLTRGLSYLFSYIVTTTHLCSPFGLKVLLKCFQASFAIQSCHNVQNLLIFSIGFCFWAAIIITFAFASGVLVFRFSFIQRHADLRLITSSSSFSSTLHFYLLYLSGLTPWIGMNRNCLANDDYTHHLNNI